MMRKGPYSIKRKSGRGFSLIELMVVISLFGILLLIGIPNLMRFRATSSAYQCARNLVSDIEFTRNLSLKIESQAAITFNTTTKSYTISYIQDLNRNGDLSDDTEKIYKRVYLSKDYGSSVSIAPGSVTEIRFVEQGFVNTTNTSDTIKVKGGGITYDIIVYKNGKCVVKEAD